MKVIREGNWPNPETWTKAVKCSHCCAELEIQTSDIQFTASTGGNPHDHCPETYRVRCGFCTNYLSLRSVDMPKSVRKKLGSYT